MISPSRPIIAPGLAALCAAAVVSAPTLSHAPAAPSASLLPVSLTAAAEYFAGSAANVVTEAAIEANHVLKDIFLYPEEFLSWAITGVVPWVIDLPFYIINSQIDLVFNLVEQLIQSPLFGVIDAITGYGNFGQDLLDGITGMGAAFENFGQGEIGFFEHFVTPPLPHFEGSHDMPPGQESEHAAAAAAIAPDNTPAVASSDTSDPGAALPAAGEHTSLFDLHPGDLNLGDLSLADFGTDLFNGSIFADLGADLANLF